MGLMMLLFFGIIATLVILALRSQSRAPDSTAAPLPERDQAERILDERFARGEIEADDHGRRRDLLRSS